MMVFCVTGSFVDAERGRPEVKPVIRWKDLVTGRHGTRFFGGILRKTRNTRFLMLRFLVL